MKKIQMLALLILFSSIAWASAVRAQSAGENVNNLLTRAAQAAGFDHIGLYNTTCARLGDPSGGRQAPPPDRDQPSGYAMEPARVFDNLYWVGMRPSYESQPGAWAVDTSGGILLLDALFRYSVEAQIVDGLEKVGLDPGRIRYVLVTHGHRDHFGGARYLQENFGATVLISEADWSFIQDRYADDPDLPIRDQTELISDDQPFTLGDTTLSLFVTPGHTPGTLSLLLPVTDRGVPHVAAMWGGTGWAFRGNSPDDVKLAVFTQYNASARRFRDIVADAGADVMLGNHSYLVLADEKNPLLESRGEGDPNPYVLGKERALAYMDVAVYCSAAGMASFR